MLMLNDDIDTFVSNVEKSTAYNLANKYNVENLVIIKKRVEAQGADAHIVDNAITLRKQMEAEAIKREAYKKEEEKRYKKARKAAILGGLVSGLFGGSSSSKSNHGDLSPWEVDEISKQNYEPMNFEEENIDEDDFYSDDLD